MTKEDYHRKRIKNILSLRNDLILKETLDSLSIEFVKSKFKFITTLLECEPDINKVVMNIMIYYNLTPNERRKVSLDMYIIRYGEKEGNKRYNERKIHNGFSEDYLMKRYNITREEARSRIDKHKNKLILSSRRYLDSTTLEERKIKKHWCIEYWLKKGFTESEAKDITTKYKNIARDSMRKNVKIKKEKMTKKELDEYNRIKNPTCEEYWVNKGNYTDSEIRDNILNHKNKLTGLKKEVWLENNNATEEDWVEFNRIRNIRRRITVSNLGDGSIRASTQSLKVFIPLVNRLKDNNLISEEDYYLGIEGKKEYWLAYSTKYYYSYDFCIPKYKIIIEYNGERWHPRKLRMSEESYNSWKMLGNNKMTATEKESYDIEKLNIAKSKNFHVLEIWDTDSDSYNIEFCFNYIVERIL